MQKNKTILLIDGSYIGHRSLYIISKVAGTEITLQTNEEMRLFVNQIFNDIISLTKSFNVNTKINNTLFFVDGKSWRHSVEMHKPYYEKEDKLIGYKENRKETKSKSNVDWENYHLCLREAADKISLEPGFLGTVDNNFEADDSIFITALNFSKVNNVIIFANDGDYEQAVVNRNIYYLRNTRAGKLKGTLIVHQSHQSHQTSTKNLSGIELIQNKMLTDASILSKLSKIEVGNHFIGSEIRKFENDRIKVANSEYFGFIKSIIGDKKDNILPIIGKYNEAGTMLTRVLEKNLISAFNSLRGSLDDIGIPSNISNNELTKLLVNDIRLNPTAKTVKSYTKMFLVNLIVQLGQQKIAKDVYKHLKLNIQLMMLTQLVHKEDLLKEFVDVVLPKINVSLVDNINMDKYDVSYNQNNVNKSNDIISQSIPD